MVLSFSVRTSQGNKKSGLLRNTPVENLPVPNVHKFGPIKPDGLIQTELGIMGLNTVTLNKPRTPTLAGA